MPAEQELTVGDKVKAIHGGPVMTVEEVCQPTYLYRYRCSWTDADGTPQHDLFRREQLERIPQ
jgi:uncharacterized protein YodC (DUF2158 family)